MGFGIQELFIEVYKKTECSLAAWILIYSLFPNIDVIRHKTTFTFLFAVPLQYPTLSLILPSCPNIGAIKEIMLSMKYHFFDLWILWFMSVGTLPFRGARSTRFHW